MRESAFLFHSGGTVQLDGLVTAVYNKTEDFGRKLNEIKKNTAKKNELMMSKQNILASDISSLTTIDNKLKVEIEQMKEKQKLTESKLSLFETDFKSNTDFAKGMYVLYLFSYKRLKKSFNVIVIHDYFLYLLCIFTCSRTMKMPT